MTRALIYHDVAANAEREAYGFPGARAARYKLDPLDFRAHLDAIAATGVSVGLLATEPSVALTFDDGGASALDIATSLEERGWVGHFFVTTGRIGTRGFVDAEQIRSLAARGHDVGSHSHSHPTYMGTLSAGALAEEWRRSREVLGEILGRAPCSAAVPGGFVSPLVIAEAANAGYELLLTSEPTRRRHVHAGMVVRGRYTVWATTSPRRAAAYARGRPWAAVTMWLAWRAKSAPKRYSPTGYEAVRRWFADHR